MKKEFQIAAKVDFEDFDRKIADIQRKLKEVTGPAGVASSMGRMDQRLGQFGLGSGQSGSAASQAAFRQNTQASRRELDQNLASEARAQERLGKLIIARTEQLKSLKAEQKAVNLSAEDELRIREKIARVQDNTQKRTEQFKQRENNINQLVEAREKMTPQGFNRISEAYKDGKLPGAANEAMKMWKELPAGQKLATGLGAAAGVAGAVGTGIQAGVGAYRYFGQAPINTIANMGSAVQGTYGRELGAAYSGRSALETSFLPEKAAAAKMAMENNDRIRGSQKWSLGGDLLSSGVQGAAGGAVTGGMMAGPWGAAGGAVVGAGMGLFKGMQGHGNYAASLFTKTGEDANNADLAKKFAEDYQSGLEGQKSANPMKTMAAEDYQANYLQNLDFQRSTGLDHDSFHGKGGYRENAINAGFSDKMAMSESSAILGAGGSTRMAQDPTSALQASRSFNVTNASSVLGTISSGLGDSASSKKAFVEMLAEGQRIGLDSSKFAEENRKFLDATAQIVAQSGSSNQGDIGGMTKRFGNFVAEDTTKGISAAQDAFKTYSDQGSQTAGPRGVMRFSAMSNDKVLGKMNGRDRAAFMAIPDDQLNADHPVVQDLATRYGTTPEEIVKRGKAANDKGRNREAGADKLQASIQSDIESLKSADPAQQLEIQKRIKQKQNRMATYKILDTQGIGSNTRNLSALAQGATGGGMNDQQIGTTGENVTDAMNDKNTGKVEDTTVQANAEGARMALENFQKMEGQLITTAGEVANFNKVLQRTVEIIGTMSAGDKAKYMPVMSSMMGVNQTQSGKPK